MSKLTAERARERIQHLKAWRDQRGLTLREEEYLEAMEGYLELEGYKEKYRALQLRWKSSMMHQREKEYALQVLQMTPEERSLWLRGSFDPEQKGKGDDGWIEWGGGECPLNPSSKVQVKLSSGDECTGNADYFVWEETPFRYEVIAYRVVQQERQPTADSCSTSAQYESLSVARAGVKV